MKTVISASRRTDLPRWFLPDVMKWFERGHVNVKNPFNNTRYKVSLKKEDVHSICWWSKDFSVFIERNAFFNDFNQYFLYTINGYDEPSDQFLEPGITTILDKRLESARILADVYGPDKINWRFDPIVFWKEKGKTRDNIADFKKISRFMGDIGVTRCTISFATWYGKCVKRARKLGFNYVIPGKEQKTRVAKEIATFNRELGILTYSCCNDDIVDGEFIYKSSCIDGNLLSKLFNEPASKARHYGQRDSCGCTKSKDIGNYDVHRCPHGCIYCYANPTLT